MRAPETIGGLSLTRQGRSWAVTHASSGVPAFRGGLRKRQFADQARADLLATGIDFTVGARRVNEQWQRWAAVHYLWTRRIEQHHIDYVTGEYYASYAQYGQFVPNERQAARIAEAMACYAWS